MIAICHHGKCFWRTVELPEDMLSVAHHLATAHTITAHPGDYLRITGHVSVPVLSLMLEIQLSYYTDYSEGCLL